VTGEVFRSRLSPASDRVLDWLRELPGPVAVTYEAGPTGFGLYRALSAAGLRCVVAAPSKIRRAPGDRVKTDANDAMLLARLLQMDEIVPVAMPTMSHEIARELWRRGSDLAVETADVVLVATSSPPCRPPSGSRVAHIEWCEPTWPSPAPSSPPSSSGTSSGPCRCRSVSRATS
jgi:hypothetical protein